MTNNSKVRENFNSNVVCFIFGTPEKTIDTLYRTTAKLSFYSYSQFPPSSNIATLAQSLFRRPKKIPLRPLQKKKPSRHNTLTEPSRGVTSAKLSFPGADELLRFTTGARKTLKEKGEKSDGKVERRASRSSILGMGRFN